MATTEEFDRHGYSLLPQSVHQWLWYYETPKGLQCIVQPRDERGNLTAAIPAMTIPWRLVEQSMKRREAAKRKRKR